MHEDFLEDETKTITSDQDYGYKITAGRRKVLLWSEAGWEKLQIPGSEDLPPGRFVAGRTEVDGVGVTVFGVCIPWKDARVGVGSWKVQRWEDHVSFLTVLQKILARHKRQRLLIIGDYNQRMTSFRDAPADVANLMKETFRDRFTIPTVGLTCDGKTCIDHIAHTGDLSITQVDALSRQGKNYRLSDHFGVAATLRAQPARD